ncbi:MAG: urea amidolyase family protein [Microbacteriaceae bacterium]|jgi:KipI family sensor histidine kinase inhibitor|nr:urea amidolyase family protein [Microbacteriaceae bacterium]MCI1207346.1 urea amidolyase family protein [Microbacteriaceae bacterium]
MRPRIRAAGLGAVLAEVADQGEASALFRTLQHLGLEGISELVPGERTVLIRYDRSVLSPGRLTAALQVAEPQSATSGGGQLVRVPVVYDGPDLEAVAALTGLSVDEVIRRHSSATYRVSFTGFAPGFAYLTGGDPALNVRRRLSPRAAVPAGAVGLAGAYSGVYPRTSPGGWQLIGTALTDMWDERREPPALLKPGMRVRFDVAQAGEVQAPAGSQDAEAATTTGIRIDDPGVRLTLQDRGRALQAGYGVTESGAMDPEACRTANRVVGNTPVAACLESWGGRIRVRAMGSQTVAVYGGGVSGAEVTRADGHVVHFPAGVPIPLQDGDLLRAGTLSGVYTYLAARGGFEAAPVLGSRSTDTLSGLGPAPVEPGRVLPVGPSPRRATRSVVAPSGMQHPGGVLVLDAIAGPRDDWFTPEGVQVFWTQIWSVSPVSDRVGIRLTGAEPPRWRSSIELPSEGMVRGAIEIPANGDPVVLMADHPVTGGYPVIACLTPEAQSLLAQAPAGTHVKFRCVAHDGAGRLGSAGQQAPAGGEK